MHNYPPVTPDPPTAPGTIKNLGPLDVQKIGNNPIKKGDKGKNVVHIQQMLFELGYDLGITKFIDGIDGILGDNTSKAIRLYQSEHRDWDEKPLKVDGIVGERTADSLNREMVGIWYPTYFSQNKDGNRVPIPPNRPLATHDPDSPLLIPASLFTVIIHGVPDPPQPGQATVSSGAITRPDRSVNYYPNDPIATSSTMREVHLLTLHSDSPSHPTFSFDSGTGTVSESGAYPGHDEENNFHINAPFNFHKGQVHVAISRTLRVWRSLGLSLSQWNGNVNISVMVRQSGNPPPNSFNAFYTPPAIGGPRLDFFQFNDRGTVPPLPPSPKWVFFCNSPDIVSHETGHAILDSIRPDLNNTIFECGAFHEAFSDISSMLATLTDPFVRETLLNSAENNLKNTSNLVSKLAEQVGKGMYNLDDVKDHPLPQGYPTKLTGPGLSNPDYMRNGINTFVYINPFIWDPIINNWIRNPALPDVFPPPPAQPVPDNQMAYEVHYFGRIFTGGFYDAFALIFNRIKNDEKTSDDALRKAANIVGRMLVWSLLPASRSPVPNAGDESPPPGSPPGSPNNPNIRFFRVIVRAMVRADQRLYENRFHEDLKNAFGDAGKQIYTDEEIDDI